MSNINNEQTYEDLLQSCEFMLDAFKKTLNTSIPGIIQSYDAQKKRAQVLPAIQTEFTNGEIASRPIIIDVPVLQPSAGGLSLILPVKAGDGVLLVFSQRGIERFKRTFQESSPTENIMASMDAVALLGFGALTASPVSPDGASIQTDDQKNYIAIDKDVVKIQKNNNVIMLDDNEIKLFFSGNSVKLNGAALISSVPIQAPSFTGVDGQIASFPSGANAGTAPLIAGGINLNGHEHIGNQGTPTSGPIGA